jgi:glucosylceramidase
VRISSTRWSSGRAQEPGRYLQVDLGRPTRFDDVAVDSGDDLGDYARGWRLSASDDGVTWHDLRSGSGTGQLTTVDVPGTRARYLRVTATGSAGSWWSIADIRLHRDR